MTLSRDEKIELARHRIAKAAGLLADSETLLSREFIRTGILAKTAAEAFRVLQARRMDSDEAADSLSTARQFVEQAGKALETLLGNQP
jgi:hypothetical protein